MIVADRSFVPQGTSADATRPPEKRRRPYLRPRILSREPLESMAATCMGTGAKAVAGLGGCQTGKTKS